MDKKTLLWVGLGFAALYFYSKSKAAAATPPAGAMPYGGGYGYGTMTGSPIRQYAGIGQELLNYLPAGMNTGSPTPA